MTDAEDGDSSFPATLGTISGPNACDGIGSQTASCSYTDGGGLTARVGDLQHRRPERPDDRLHDHPANPDGINGWYKSDVSLVWTVTEPESPTSLKKTGCVDQTITTTRLRRPTRARRPAPAARPARLGDHQARCHGPDARRRRDHSGQRRRVVQRQRHRALDRLGRPLRPRRARAGRREIITDEGDNLAATATVADQAGNKTTKTVGPIKIDRTAPTTTVDTPELPASGWYTGAVNVTLHSVDNLSQVAQTHYKVDGGATQQYTDPFSHSLNGVHDYLLLVGRQGRQRRGGEVDQGQDRRRQADDRGLPDARRERLRLEQQQRSRLVHMLGRRLRHRRRQRRLLSAHDAHDEGAGQTVTGTALDVAGNTRVGHCRRDQHRQDRAERHAQRRARRRRQLLVRLCPGCADL